MQKFVDAINAGNAKQAIILGEEFMAKNPNHARAIYYLAASYALDKQINKALMFFQKSEELGYKTDEFYRNFATVYKDANNLEKSVEYYLKCLEIKPDDEIAATGLVQNMLELKHPQSEFYAKKFVQMFPTNSFFKLLVARAIQGDSKKNGLEYFEAELAQNPDDLDIMAEYALALHEQGKSDIAYPMLKKVCYAQPDNIDNLANLALVESSLGMSTDSYRHFRKIIETTDNPAFDSNFGKLLIKMRRYHEGWERNESRLKTKDLVVNHNPINLIYWQGEAIHNSKLLIIGEQGVGDQINFAVDLQRTIDFLKQFNTQVILTVKPKLETIFRRNFDVFVPENGLLSEHLHYKNWQATHYCYMGSLMKINQLFITHNPSPPWIHADGEYLNRAKAVLYGENPQQKWIGLQIKSGIEDNRSFNPTDLEPLAQLQRHGYKFLSLQYAGSQDMVAKVQAASGVFMHLINGADLWDDIEAVCGLTMACDSVIMNDTTNAHIAGALGQKGYLVLPLEAVWRWGFKYKPLPWYPNLTILREDSRGSYRDLMAVIAQNILRKDGIIA